MRYPSPSPRPYRTPSAMRLAHAHDCTVAAICHDRGDVGNACFRCDSRRRPSRRSGRCRVHWRWPQVPAQPASRASNRSLRICCAACGDGWPRANDDFRQVISGATCSLHVNRCERTGRRHLDQPASVEIAKQTLMSGGLILAVGTVIGLFAQKTKIPDVAVFLLAGMLIGPQALGLIDIKADSALYQILLLFGASYILFDGGASLRFHVMKQVWITIVVIATVGVVITAAITTTAAYFVLGAPLIVAALLGATLASTDPATLVPIFRQVHIRDRVAQTVMSE